jgi:hypothetical protein
MGGPYFRYLRYEIAIDWHEQPKVLTVAPSSEKLPTLSRHAFGVDNVA